ncbi:MAG: hypothetical protein IJ710_03490, partial [Prevotella sp.]|nr:hypothetical protein [Prevotella sp.]
HYKRKYAEYYNFTNRKSNAVTAVLTGDAESGTVGTFSTPLSASVAYSSSPASTAIGGLLRYNNTGHSYVFKFSTRYRLDTEGKEIFSTSLANPTWVNINVKARQNWLYYDKARTDDDGKENQTTLTSRRTLPPTTLKGLHWALVGDPYKFTAVNRRRWEDSGRPTSATANADCWLGTHYGENSSGEWYNYLRQGSTDECSAYGEGKATGSYNAANGNTEWSLVYRKTDNSFVWRTASLKTGTGDAVNASDDNKTNRFLVLTSKDFTATQPAGESSAFVLQPFSLATKVTNENLNPIEIVPMKKQGNDCFDANVYVYSTDSEKPKAFLLRAEMGYGDDATTYDAVSQMPCILRRYGCSYTCYDADYNPATHSGTSLPAFTSSWLATKSEPVTINYQYTVSESTARFFTGAEEALQGEYTWANTYYNWNETYKGNNTRVVVWDWVDVGPHYNEDGKIDGRTYEWRAIEQWLDGQTVNTPVFGWVNSKNDSRAYADETSQNDNASQKWALTGDPYNFDLKNYAKYMDGDASSLAASGSAISFGNTAGRWALAVDTEGKPYLALTDDNGNISQYVSFDRTSSGSSTDQYLKLMGNRLSDATGNILNLGGAHPFYLSDLRSYAAIVEYHLVIAHKHSLDAEDFARLSQADKQTIVSHLREYLKYKDPALLSKVKATEILETDKPEDIVTDETARNKIIQLLSGRATDNSTGGTLRDLINDPIEDKVVTRVGKGNMITIPWYMKRQFCKYTLYQRDVQELTDDGTGTGNKKWVSVAESDPAHQHNGSTVDRVMDYHKDRKLIVDVVYDVDPDKFHFSNQGRNTTRWYSLMTQNANDGLLNFSYSNGVGARLDRSEHYTNNYLWAPTGDPYGFVLHNRYATVNGTGWDQVVITSEGHLPNKTDGMAGYYKIFTTADDSATVDGITYTGVEIPVRYIEKRISHLVRGDVRPEGSKDAGTTVETDGAVNAVYEMMVGNFENSFLIHPTRAWIDPKLEDYSSYYVTHVTANGAFKHRAQLYFSTAEAARANADANWHLETTAEQLWPYFNRTGYVGGLKPELATSFQNQQLRNRIQEYVEQPELERDYQVIRDARDLVYAGTFFNA